MNEENESRANGVLHPARECCFGWLSMLAAYLYCRIFPAFQSPLGSFLLVVGIAILFAAWVRLWNLRPGLLGNLSLVLALAFAAAQLVNSSETVRLLAWLCSTVFLVAYPYYASESALGNGFHRFLAGDALRAILLRPFLSFAAVWPALFRREGRRGLFVKVLLGILIALIPTAAVYALLSYDEAFTGILNSIFRITPDAWGSRILSLFLCVPIGMYLFGVLYSAVWKGGSGTGSAAAARWERFSAREGALSSVTLTIAAIPVLFLYVVFFFSQWRYYTSAFAGVVFEGMSYAEYAREGFFQLCTVSGLNLLFVALFGLLVRRREGKVPGVMRAVCLVFGLVTLLLLATAGAKLALYIGAYGLTQLRVYSACFMVVLLVWFVLVCIGQFLPDMKTVTAMLLVGVFSLLAFSLCPTDRLIAKYNVDRYLEGSLENVDVYTLQELGDDAVSELLRLAEAVEEETGKNLKRTSRLFIDPGVYDLETETYPDQELWEAVSNALYELRNETRWFPPAKDSGTESASLFEQNLPSLRAAAALRQAGYLQ